MQEIWNWLFTYPRIGLAGWEVCWYSAIWFAMPVACWLIEGAQAARLREKE